ncbi:DNA processing protein [Inquilinus ginsengisoli]|uniref:DNA processing protein n=1 Tax=Inquilinus ginsengisoli TaxID=363840 RepID=A0ABU1JUT1_9PROT|nr:DNA-processing protein DprA [Inquilinus ginsengisoli]MDR6292378.1 DNA processing protein [Inquilinus ginsengisoli]
MAVTLAHAAGHSVKRSKYTPPSTVQDVSLNSLIRGTNRLNAKVRQLKLGGDLQRGDYGDQILHCAGDLSLAAAPSVAIIGTREVSFEGAARARRIAKELVPYGIVVVSGLARGVDTEAMTSAIRHDGRTIGVIGTPITQAYPAENSELQETVYLDHLLISQFGVGASVFKANFPTRNRLMAVMSDATIVIEASDTSGTLHQAAECMRIGRPLFIAKAVAENRSLSWPGKFVGKPNCYVLERTDDVLAVLRASNILDAD